MLIYVAISGDSNMIMKEGEMILKIIFQQKFDACGMYKLK
jgi:hypothetical protein